MIALPKIVHTRFHCVITTKTTIDSQHNYAMCLQMLGIKDVNVNLARLEITSGHYCIPMNPNKRML